MIDHVHRWSLQDEWYWTHSIIDSFVGHAHDNKEASFRIRYFARVQTVDSSWSGEMPRSDGYLTQLKEPWLSQGWSNVVFNAELLLLRTMISTGWIARRYLSKDTFSALVATRNDRGWKRKSLRLRCRCICMEHQWFGNGINSKMGAYSSPPHAAAWYKNSRDGLAKLCLIQSFAWFKALLDSKLIQTFFHP